MVGGNLILNTREEVDFVYGNLSKLPDSLNVIPYYDPAINFPPQLTRSGWYKIHPRIHQLKQNAIGPLCQSLRESTERPKGIMVHAFPWGPEIEFNVSLPLVIELAQALPQIPVLVTHGGAYESWAFRAHTGMLKNVVYDFSLTMAYYKGSDVLRPFQRYLKYSSDRIVFGSDWPSAESAEQLAECIRLAAEMEINEAELEARLLENAQRLWPQVQA